jgi:hypothetical protein
VEPILVSLKSPRATGPVLRQNYCVGGRFNGEKFTEIMTPLSTNLAQPLARHAVVDGIMRRMTGGGWPNRQDRMPQLYIAVCLVLSSTWPADMKTAKSSLHQQRPRGAPIFSVAGLTD